MDCGIPSLHQRQVIKNVAPEVTITSTTWYNLVQLKELPDQVLLQPGSNLNFHSRLALRHTLRLELSWAGPMFGNVSSPSNLSLPILVKSHQPGLSLICFIISTSSQGPENSKSFCAPRCNLSHPSSLEFAAP